MRKYYHLLVLLFTQHVVFAQQEVEMADTFRSEGKIYVVVAIVTLILLGLIGYLILIDRKVNKLEKRLTDKK